MDKQQPTPPSWSTRFLAWFLKTDYYEDVQGDLEEEFRLRGDTSGWEKANRWYSWQVVRLLRPSMAKEVKPNDSIEKETSMFKNYLKIGLRNLWKYKAGTVINVIGLSTGLAAFILIALFIRDEWSYDRNHVNGEDIYRVTVKNYSLDGNLSRQWAFASAGHATRLKEDYPEISHAARFFAWAYPDLNVGDKKFPSEPVIFADNDVFDIFTFPFIEGNAETAFTDLYSLVLTEASAIKLFGNDWRELDIIGKQVTLARDGQEAPFKVSAVMENMPEQQHFHFEYLAPIRFLEMIVGEETVNNVSGNYNWPTYIKVTPNADMRALTDRSNNEFWDKYIGEIRGLSAQNFYDFEFQPLFDIHLLSNLEGEFEVNGSYQQVVIFSIVGILLLLVACVNYMNIATSHYSRRMKEVGVRKVIGAFKSSLVKQFLTESVLITIISFPLCVLLVIWALPYLNDFMEKTLSFDILGESKLLVGVLGLLLAVGIIAGLYPALFLSKVNLVNALKGEQSIKASKWNFRSWLVTFQYTVTIALIFAISVIESQMSFIRQSDPGYSKDQVLVLSLTRNLGNLETFRNELLSHPNIVNATYSTRIPTGRLLDNWGSSFYKGDSAVSTDFRLPIVSVDPYFLETYDIPLVAGENFTENMETVLVQDSTTTGYYIINEAAAKAYGFSNPEEIVGRRMSYGPSEGRIVGVMKDFHFESMHTEIVPMLIMYRDQYRRLSMKLSGGELPATLEFVESTFAKFDQETAPRYHFLDKLFDEQYEKEERLSSMIKVFAVIAILISCLGLVGMVGFIMETKLKEIGVRKVLGASSQSIWILISNRFLILIGIGSIIALPLTYYLMDGWLEDFVYRTSIGVGIIVFPAVATLIITLLTISYQTVKATQVNPVECLKDE